MLSESDDYTLINSKSLQYMYYSTCITVHDYSTVNVVNFAWGKFRKNVGISHGGNFHDNTPISFIKTYGVFFAWGNFREED